jgi:hypothetical protein
MCSLPAPPWRSSPPDAPQPNLHCILPAPSLQHFPIFEETGLQHSGAVEFNDTDLPFKTTASQSRNKVASMLLGVNTQNEYSFQRKLKRLLTSIYVPTDSFADSWIVAQSLNDGIPQLQQKLKPLIYSSKRRRATVTFA